MYIHIYIYTYPYIYIYPYINIQSIYVRVYFHDYYPNPTKRFHIQVHGINILGRVGTTNELRKFFLANHPLWIIQLWPRISLGTSQCFSLTWKPPGMWCWNPTNTSGTGVTRRHEEFIEKTLLELRNSLCLTIAWNNSHRPLEDPTFCRNRLEPPKKHPVETWPSLMLTKTHLVSNTIWPTHLFLKLKCATHVPRLCSRNCKTSKTSGCYWLPSGKSPCLTGKSSLTGPFFSFLCTYYV